MEILICAKLVERWLRKKPREMPIKDQPDERIG